MCLSVEAKNVLTRFFEKASELYEEHASSKSTHVEIEARIGTILSSGGFVAGVSPGRFRFLQEWFDESLTSVTAKPWNESLMIHKGSTRTCTSKGEDSFLVDKQVVRSVVVKSNHPEGIAFKFVIALEKRIEAKQATEIPFVYKPAPFQVARLRHRKSYLFGGKDNDTFSLDFTLIWSAATEKAAREALRRGDSKRFEIELELLDNSYMNSKTPEQMSLSFSSRLASLFEFEVPNGFLFDKVKDVF